MKRKIFFILLVITLCCVSIFAQVQAVVIKSNAPLREKPNKKSKIILAAKKGVKFILLGDNPTNGWYYVSDLDRNQVGWIFGKNIRLSGKPKPVESAVVREWEINKIPLEVLGDFVNDKLAKNEVDLSKPFFVVLDGTLTADGKFDSKKSKFIQMEGDEQMTIVAKNGIAALGDSGVLGFLKVHGAERINLTLVQDNEKMYAIIVCEQKSKERALTLASGMNFWFTGLRFADEQGSRKMDETTRILVKNSTVKAEGVNFILNFSLPKSVAREMIENSLKKQFEKKRNQ